MGSNSEQISFDCIDQNFELRLSPVITYLKYLFPLFELHASKLSKLSACIAKCMTTINKIYMFLHFYTTKYQYLEHRSCFVNCLRKFKNNQRQWQTILLFEIFNLF